MKKEHTPGPWEVTRRPGRMYVSDANGYNVMAGLSTSPLTMAELEANARLISAAPELLDALTDLVGGCGKEGDLFNGAAMEKASAAIAKATGGA